jgi:uncharacterized protein (DUF433 family)
VIAFCSGQHLLAKIDGDMAGKKKVVHSDPEIMHGEVVFVGTRVPVQSLFDHLEGGDTLDDFLTSFPTVHRSQAIAALKIAREALADSAHLP